MHFDIADFTDRVMIDCEETARSIRHRNRGCNDFCPPYFFAEAQQDDRSGSGRAYTRSASGCYKLLVHRCDYLHPSKFYDKLVRTFLIRAQTAFWLHPAVCSVMWASLWSTFWGDLSWRAEPTSRAGTLPANAHVHMDSRSQSDFKCSAV